MQVIIILGSTDWCDYCLPKLREKMWMITEQIDKLGMVYLIDNCIIIIYKNRLTAAIIIIIIIRRG